jgi:cytochrome b
VWDKADSVKIEERLTEAVLPYNFFRPDAGPAWLQGIGFVILLALIMVGAFGNAIGATIFTILAFVWLIHGFWEIFWPNPK